MLRNGGEPQCTGRAARQRQRNSDDCVLGSCRIVYNAQILRDYIYYAMLDVAGGLRSNPPHLKIGFSKPGSNASIAVTPTPSFVTLAKVSPTRNRTVGLTRVKGSIYQLSYWRIILQAE